MFVCGRNMEVILYDKDEMKCYGGYLSNVAMELDCTTIEDSSHRVIRGISNTTANMVIELNQEIIQLDPTTMKRIAQYNLEKENGELLKEIGQNRKIIESLKKQYEELKFRLQTISDIGTDIWEHGTEYAEKEEYEESDWND